MPLFLVRFTVAGKGHFPVDMLRYDSCHPSDSRAVDSMGYDDTYQRGEVRKVTLTTFVNSTLKHTQDMIDRRKVPTVDRWRSFGWSVERIESPQKCNSL